MSIEVGPYVLGRTLGIGTTGKVKLAVHRTTGAKVAVKILKKSLLSSDALLQRRVHREIAVLKLLDCPSVMKLYDVFETPERLYLILEYVCNGELFDFLTRRRRLELHEALSIFEQILEGVYYCHRHLICHRDLKPENLLLNSDMDIKIGDFGMASLMRDGKWCKTSCGSPHYAAPEVVAGLEYDGTRADVWSCGVILFALVTGRLPFDDPDIPTLLDKVKNAAFAMPSDIPSPVQELLYLMLDKDPSKRASIATVRDHSCFRGDPLSAELGCMEIETNDENNSDGDCLSEKHATKDQSIGKNNHSSPDTTLNKNVDCSPHSSQSSPVSGYSGDSPLNISSNRKNKRSPCGVQILRSELANYPPIKVSDPSDLDIETRRLFRHLGWTDENELVHALTRTEANLEKVLHNLLLERKKRLVESERISVSVSPPADISPYGIGTNDPHRSPSASVISSDDDYGREHSLLVNQHSPWRLPVSTHPEVSADSPGSCSYGSSPKRSWFMNLFRRNKSGGGFSASPPNPMTITATSQRETSSSSVAYQHVVYSHGHNLTPVEYRVHSDEWDALENDS